MDACGGMDELARLYVRELTETLQTRDVDRVKTLYLRWRVAMELPSMPDDDRLEIDMHKMILELPALEDLHAESAAFLEEHGEAWAAPDAACRAACHGCCAGGSVSCDALHAASGEMRVPDGRRAAGASTNAPSNPRPDATGDARR